MNCHNCHQPVTEKDTITVDGKDHCIDCAVAVVDLAVRAAARQAMESFNEQFAKVFEQRREA